MQVTTQAVAAISHRAQYAADSRFNGAPFSLFFVARSCYELENRSGRHVCKPTTHWSRMTLQTLICGLLSAVSPAFAQTDSATPPTESIMLRAERMLDVRTGKYISPAAVYIEGERIKAAGAAEQVLRQAPADLRVVDLGAATLLPGLIDCHTHLMARIPAGANGYAINLLTKSQAYRALEGAADARATLEAGFTSVRDVESEGSGYADVALRDAINEGLVPGPRMHVATRGIAAVGQYYPLDVRPDLPSFPTGAQMISGVEEARRAVREQIGNGADLIKVYADWENPTLTVDELRVIVEEAHKAKRRVAAHATTADGIRNALQAGVDSIEHGHRADKADIELMKAKGVYLVFTVSGMDASVAANPERWKVPPASDLLNAKNLSMTLARQFGVKIANGSDAASAKSHGRNARELESMVRHGFAALDAIRAATISAADLIGVNDVGVIEAGRYADLIAVRGDPLTDITVLQSVAFVMKGGQTVRNDLRSAAP
jgi:imidazolonepropionase-like amidohydrolase